MSTSETRRHSVGGFAKYQEQLWNLYESSFLLSIRSEVRVLSGSPLKRLKNPFISHTFPKLPALTPSVGPVLDLCRNLHKCRTAIRRRFVGEACVKILPIPPNPGCLYGAHPHPGVQAWTPPAH